MQVQLSWTDNADNEASQNVYVTPTLGVGAVYTKVATVAHNVSEVVFTPPSELLGQHFYVTVTAENALGETPKELFVLSIDPQLPSRFVVTSMALECLSAGHARKTLKTHSHGQVVNAGSWAPSDWAVLPNGRTTILRYDSLRVLDPETMTLGELPSYSDPTLTNNGVICSPQGLLYTFSNWFIYEHGGPGGARLVATVEGADRGLFIAPAGGSNLTCSYLNDGTLIWIQNSDVVGRYVVLRVDPKLGTVNCHQINLDFGFTISGTKYGNPLPDGRFVFMHGKAGATYEWFATVFDPATDTIQTSTTPHQLFGIIPYNSRVVGNKVFFMAKKEWLSTDPVTWYVADYVSDQPLVFRPYSDSALKNVKQSIVLPNGLIVLNNYTSPNGPSLFLVDLVNETHQELRFPDPEGAYNGFQAQYMVRTARGVMQFNSTGASIYYELDEDPALTIDSQVWNINY